MSWAPNHTWVRVGDRRAVVARPRALEPLSFIVSGPERIEAVGYVARDEATGAVLTVKTGQLADELIEPILEAARNLFLQARP